MQNNNTAIILDDLQIAQVEALANYLPIEQVAGYFNISVSDFLDLQKKDKRVLRAYRKGKIRGVCKVATLLWQQMEAGNVTALIFFLKTRGDWREKPIAETGDSAHKVKNIKFIYNNCMKNTIKLHKKTNVKKIKKYPYRRKNTKKL